MASLGEDTYKHGLRIGREENLTEVIICLMDKEGWSLEKALDTVCSDVDIRKNVEERVRSILK